MDLVKVPETKSIGLLMDGYTGRMVKVYSF
jgi:hypothetical protein